MTMTIPDSLEANERLQALGEQLIPGIPDEITLGHIASKLHWTDFDILSSVSHAWLQAIRTYRVYDARVRSHSTETLLLLSFKGRSSIQKIGLFDTRVRSFRWLPQIPNLTRMFPRECKVVSIDAKVYVLGGKMEPKYGDRSSDTVYVLDLAGRRQWKQCARMKNSRVRFGCGVLNGKIYVFGGLSEHLVPGSEVYDADQDTWSPIKPMISLLYGHRVQTVGAELFVHGGMEFNRDYFDSVEDQMMVSDDDNERSESLQVYHPGKAEWREVTPFAHNMHGLFTANGKMHGTRRIDASSSIADSYVYDLDANSWEDQHSFSFAAIGRNRSSYLDSVLMVDDELFAFVRWYKCYEGTVKEMYCLLQSKGFGSTYSEGGMRTTLLNRNSRYKEINWQRQLNFRLNVGCIVEICSAIKL